MRTREGKQLISLDIGKLIDFCATFPQWLRCKKGHPSPTRWGAAKPSEQWLKKKGYYMREGRDFGEPPEHESWMVLCLRCEKPIELGSTGGRAFC